jgi:hypothetical protein
VTTSNVHPFPALKPGYRLVPALIGTRKNAQIVYIPCPLWCTEDHAADPYMLEDVTHTSQAEELEIGSFLKRGASLLMFATVQADPCETNPMLKAAHIAVDSGDLPDYLTPEMTEAFADDLIGFASQLRHLARTARLHNQAADNASTDAKLHAGGGAV